MLLLALLLAVVLAAPAEATAPWRWPLRGDVLTGFHVAPNPFAAGQHRGIDIAARAGAPVRSVCPGRVRFAGSVPGRGRVVTVRCGPLVATYLELATTAVRRGAPVAAGALVGTVAASHLQLGARRAGSRTGYVDPLPLLTTAMPPPLGAAPGRRPAWGRRPPPPGAAPRPRPPAASPHPAPRPLRRPLARLRTDGRGSARVSIAAWAGLALLAAGTPLGALWRRRRREARRLSTRIAAGP